MFRPSRHEKLMVVYFDMLMLDDQSLLGVKHSERFKLLEKTIHCEHGRAELVDRTLIDFGRQTSASELRKAFAAVITAKGEGLVLKPDEPYFSFFAKNRRQAGLCIKLKKEYIGNFGDIGDFAVVGAGFNAAKAKSFRIPNLQWTSFFVGCLDNKEQVKRWDEKPHFTVICAVELNEQLLKTVLAHGNPAPVSIGDSKRTILNVPRVIESDSPMTIAFENPLVFDIRCFSFDKPGNTGFWTLRFPVVSKVHFDRDFSDCVTFAELQQMAKEAISTPEPDDSQENLQWIARLEAADPRGRAVDAVSQMTATTMPTPSPTSSRQRISPSSARSISRSPLLYRNSQSRHIGSTAGAVLLTPPTSSLPSGQTPSVPTTKMPKRKICSSSSIPPSSPCTKRARLALETVDGNASQQSVSLSSSIRIDRDGQEQLDVLKSPKRSFPTHRAGGRAKQTVLAPTMSLSSTQDDKQPQRQQQQSKAGYKAIRSKAGVASGKTVCQYAGDKCHLSRSTVILATEVLSPWTAIADLIDKHGVMETTTHLEQWLSDRTGSTTGKKRCSSIILLVDSVEKSNETKKLMSRIESVRGNLPRRTRRWIEVYDWRMLEHLRIMEDPTQQKYYDGFSDPWRRWYCGIL